MLTQTHSQLCYEDKSEGAPDYILGRNLTYNPKGEVILKYSWFCYDTCFENTHLFQRIGYIREQLERDVKFVFVNVRLCPRETLGELGRTV